MRSPSGRELPTPHLPARLVDLVQQWADFWHLSLPLDPEAPDALDIGFSERMSRTLGRCNPEAGRIRLAAHLADGPERLLEEVLCHELAHVAVHRLQQRSTGSHGQSWRRLVELAGYPTRIRAPASTAPTRPTSNRARTARYEHRCPVCHTVRVARQPVQEWRCADCAAAGLPGAMRITCLSEPA